MAAARQEMTYDADTGQTVYRVPETVIDADEPEPEVPYEEKLRQAGYTPPDNSLAPPVGPVPGFGWKAGQWVKDKFGPVQLSPGAEKAITPPSPEQNGANQLTAAASKVLGPAVKLHPVVAVAMMRQRQREAEDKANRERAEKVVELNEKEKLYKAALDKAKQLSKEKK